MPAFLDRWRKEEQFFFHLTMAAAVAAYFSLILLMEFQSGDDLQTLTLARHSTFSVIFSSSVYNLGEYYRPVILAITKFLLTPSFSVLPFRIVQIFTGAVIVWFAVRSIRNLRTSSFGVALLILLLIASPFTHGTFTWWADMGGRHALLALVIGAYFVTAERAPSWMMTFPVLTFALLSHEIALACAALFCALYLVHHRYASAAGVIALVLAYVTLRSVMLGGVVPHAAFLRPQGFLFTWIPDDATFSSILGGRRAVLYAYNVIAQFFAVFFAVPDEGLLALGGWRQISAALLQSLSTFLLLVVLWHRRSDRAVRIVAGLFLLAIIANVFIGYASPRFRTIVVAGAAHMLLFVWAADVVWTMPQSHPSRLLRWMFTLVLVLFLGWGGAAALRLADLAHGVLVQRKGYALEIPPPGPEIDRDLYEAVQRKYLTDPATCAQFRILARLLSRCPLF